MRTLSWLANRETLLTYRSIPKSTPKLDGLKQDWLGLLEAQIISHTRAHAHRAKAR